MIIAGLLVVASAYAGGPMIENGRELKPGERLRTEADGGLIIRYPDGSRVLLGASSDFTVEEKFKGTQWNRLRAGSLHVKVPAGEGRFLVRTDGLAASAREADFVIEQRRGEATIHALEGSIEHARDPLALLGGKGTQLGAGFSVSATARELNPPRAFDREKYVEELRGGLPEPAPEPAKKAPVEEAEAARIRANRSQAPVPEAKFAPPPRLADSGAAPSELQLRLLGFELGGFYVQSAFDGAAHSAPAVAWSPELGFTSLKLISFRGNVGFALASGPIRAWDYGATVVLTFLHVFLEGGAGFQAWGPGGPSGQSVTAKGGIILSETGLLRRLFGGFEGQGSTSEYRVGLGIGF